MLTKIKLAIALSATLITGAVGVAAANGGGGGGRQAMLQKYDTNGDGKLDDAERAAMKADWQAKHAQRKAEMLAKYDINHDGKLDDTERATMKADRAAKDFARMDTNGDGQISIAEFQAARAARGGHHGHHHRHGMKPGFSQGGGPGTGQ